jgi:hypothetical protein
MERFTRRTLARGRTSRRLRNRAAKDSNLSTLWDEEKRRFAMM